MDINLVDVTVHIDEDLSPETRITVEDSLRALDGVVSVHGSSKTPHLTMCNIILKLWTLRKF